MSDNELRFLCDKAFDYGIELSHHQLNLFHIYLTELWDWNQRINLTGLSTRNRMVIELLLDSLIPAPYLPGKGEMLDVGSGAGFPGVPLKIYSPHLKTHLLETNTKKVNFLKQVIRLLRLDEIEVIKGRIEKDGRNLHPGNYNLITARALAGLRQTITWCSPFLLPGGLLVTFLGSRVEEDLKKSEQAMKKHSVMLNKIIPYLLPGKRSQRNVLIFRKRV